MKKKLMIVASALVLTAAVGVITRVSASADQERGYPPMIAALIERFNLNEEEVNSFLEEQRSEREADREAQIEEQLNTAVAEGKITEEQKYLILEKMEEWKNSRDEWHNLTPEERSELADGHHNDMETWCEENNIDLHEILDGGFMFGGPKDGPRGMGSKIGSNTNRSTE